MAVELETRHQAFLHRGDTATANVLARLAASAGPAMVRELKRRNQTRDYPTVLVGLWRKPNTRLDRDPDTRPDLRRLLRTALKVQQANLAWQDVRAWLQFVADHERLYREFLMAALLANLAEQATRPDERAVAKVARAARTAAKEWEIAELLRKGGHPDEAAVHTKRALLHLWCAQKLAREWTPDAEALIHAVRGPLSWQIGFLGYGITAQLVGAALNQQIDRLQVRYLIKSSTCNPAISTR
jgi:hypothetical protein